MENDFYHFTFKKQQSKKLKMRNDEENYPKASMKGTMERTATHP